MTQAIADVLDAAADRECKLAAHADLYDRIHAFMESLTKETFAAYDAVRDKPECATLMAVHRTALQIKQEYRGIAAGNRQDVELYAKLREAATTARQSNDMEGEGR